MRQVSALLVVCILLAAPISADEVTYPDWNNAYGLTIVRKGNQTTVSLGGLLTPRHVKVKTGTPDGPIVSRFKMPSLLHAPSPAPLPNSAPGTVQVTLPDPFAVVYIEGELIRTSGIARQFESPTLHPGKDFPLHVRAAYMVGEKFIIEDKHITIRAGESASVNFDGSRALVVPLPAKEAR